MLDYLRQIPLYDFSEPKYYYCYIMNRLLRKSNTKNELQTNLVSNILHILDLSVDIGIPKSTTL